MRVLTVCLITVLIAQVSVVQCDESDPNSWWYWFFGNDDPITIDYSDSRSRSNGDYSQDWSYSEPRASGIYEYQSDEPYGDSSDDSSSSMSSSSSSSEEYSFKPLEDDSESRDGREVSDNEVNFTEFDRTGVSPVDPYSVRNEASAISSPMDVQSDSGDVSRTTNLVEPTEASRTTNLVEPTDENRTTNFIEPTEVSRTTNLVEPADATQSTNSVEPADDTQSTSLVEPTEESRTTNFIEPTEESRTTNLVEPADATQSTNFVEPTEASRTPISVEPIDASQMSNSIAPTDVSQTQIDVEPTDAIQSPTIQSNDSEESASVETTNAAENSTTNNETNTVVDKSDSNDEFEKIFGAGDSSHRLEREFWARFITALLDPSNFAETEDDVPVPQPDGRDALDSSSEESGEFTQFELFYSTLTFYSLNTPTHTHIRMHISLQAIV